ILEQRQSKTVAKLRVGSEFVILPTGEALGGAYPERTVARHDKPRNRAGSKMLVRRWLPGDVADTIEAVQAEFHAQPKIAVGRLSDSPDRASGKALPALPCRVSVLAEVQRRVQCERAGAPGQQRTGQQNARSSHNRLADDDHSRFKFISPFPSSTCR